MIKQQLHNQAQMRSHAYLYAVVYRSVFSVCLVVTLLLSFMVQPIHQAYANESEEIEDTAEEVLVETEKEQPIPDVVTDDEIEEVVVEVYENSEEEALVVVDEDIVVDPVQEEVDENLEPALESTTFSSSSAVEEASQEVPSQSEATSSSATDDLLDQAETTSSTPSSTVETGLQATPAATTSNDSADNNSPSLSGGGSGGAADISPETTNEDTKTPNEDVPEPSLGNEDESDDDTARATATSSQESTDLSTETPLSTQYLVTEDNFYQFGRDACVLVGGGSYHCSIESNVIVDAQAVVYSEMTAEGDSEIFIKTKRGTVEQLTDNTYEDTSPHYDPESLRIAWQRLIDGRYQIILYDLTTKVEKQLTFTRQNSMEPAVSNAGVAWQTWDGSDWEIMFYDGTYTDQLTDNLTQDLDPSLEDTYIIWTVVGQDTQVAQVYSLDSKEIMTISNHDGGSIVNPRFVLVYDTQFENGDIITQGFDPETGFSSPIAAVPAPEPINIPHSDPVGEIRALIQNKTTDEELSEEVNTDGDEPELDPETVKASTTPGTLVIDTGTTSPDVLEEVVTELLEDDLDIDEQVNVVSTSTEQFSLGEGDLVITPGGDVSTSSASSTETLIPIHRSE